VAVVPVAVLCIVLGIPLFAITTSSAAKPGGSVAGVPDRVLRAYRAVDGWCPGLRWQLVAGIGSIESGHGTSGGASADPETGEVVPHIFGIPLDGSPGIEELPIGRWLGWFGLAGPWQQAVVISGWDRALWHVSGGALRPRVIGVSDGSGAGPGHVGHDRLVTPPA